MNKKAYELKKRETSHNPCAGITRFRFGGYNLSLHGTPLFVTAKITRNVENKNIVNIIYTLLRFWHFCLFAGFSYLCEYKNPNTITMKSFHDLLFNRRSIRKYTDAEISADDVKTILQAALVAPSSKGKMPWQFVAVDDSTVLEQMSKCKDFGARPIAGCALAIVVTANPYESDAWIEDASIAAFAMQMQAQDLGLGSCWVQVRERYDKEGKPAEDNVRELLNIPPDQRVLCVVTIGHKNEERKPLEEEKCQWEKVHIGTWRNEEQ